MFTGIIENTGIIESTEKKGSNITFWITASLATDLKVDQSVSHNGVCLTVEEVKNHSYRVTAIEETLMKTDLGTWTQGSMINLERSMLMNGRIDGHIVQGHVDTTAICTAIADKGGSKEFTFTIKGEFPQLMIEKGSIAVNGISLTIFNVTDIGFRVAVIPYTLQHTNMQCIKVNSLVNIEFDILGKYISRMMDVRNR